MKRFVVPSLLLSLVLCAGAHAGEAVSPKIDSAAAKALAKANNALSRDLYRVLCAGDENIVFSPYSIQSALLMGREGASGETAAQFDRVLHVSDMARGRSYRALRDSLRPGELDDGRSRTARKRPVFELRVANAAWAQRRYFVKNTFLKPLRDDYGAPLLRVDFESPVRASQVVNSWAARNTRNRIRGTLSPDAIPPLTRLILASAVYFKAAWLDEFYEGNTKPEVFYGPGGSEKKVPLMRRQDRYGYAEIEGVQVLSLPYLRGETGMQVFLPRERDGLTSLEAKYVAGKLDGWREALKVQEVDVKLPKFEFASQYRLNDALAKLGMNDAFDPGAADFTRVSNEKGLFLGTVAHKAFISVDEEGTEAAAVTALMAEGSAAPGTPENPIVFRADHPFLFQITHAKTGAILFVGRVTEP